jgi:hypothetical protein
MSEEKEKAKEKPEPPSQAELLREALAGREFTLADAIGRLAGPGMMKGVSPVTGKDQAVVQIHEYLNHHLTDGAGALSSALFRRVRESEMLAKGFERPLETLIAYVGRILASEFELKDLVRETDVEWGRVFGERPMFEIEGRPTSPDDPYTIVSVGAALAKLDERLKALTK